MTMQPRTMRVIPAVFFALSSAMLTNAQQITYGGSKIDRFNSVHPTADGGYIMGGESASFVDRHKDAYIVKTDVSGKVQWSRTIGGMEAENLNDVKPTPDGGYIAVGEKYLVSGDRLLGEVGSLVKLDNNGNVLWSKTFHSGCREAEGFSLQITPDEGFMVTGMMRSSENVSNVYFPMKSQTDHLFVMTTDKGGNELWSGFFTTQENALGSKGRHIAPANDGGFIIAGHFYVVQNDNYTKIALLKLDPSGNFDWFKLYDAKGEGEETAGSIEQTADGGFIVAGTTNDAGLGKADVLLFKTDAAGNVQWAKAYGGANVDYGQRLVQTADGYVIAGSTLSFGQGTFDVYALKTDKNGNLLWSKAYGGDRYDSAFDIKPAKNGFIISGFTLSAGAGSYDAYIVITDEKGASNCMESNADTKTVDVTLEVESNPTGITWVKIANSSEFNENCDITQKLSQEKTEMPATQTAMVCN